MRTMHFDATRVARPDSLLQKSTDDLAAELISSGYIYDDHYLEMRYLDPKWMVAVHVLGLSLYRALGGEPNPASKLDRG